MVSQLQLEVINKVTIMADLAKVIDNGKSFMFNFEKNLLHTVRSEDLVVQILHW